MEERLQEQMALLHIRNAMSIDNLIHLADENTVHESFNDEDLLQMADEGADEGKDESEDEEAEPKVTANELLASLHIVIRKLEEDPTANRDILVPLRKLQRTTTREQAQQYQASLMQKDIRNFFV